MRTKGKILSAEEQKKRTKQALMMAALEVFREKGYNKAKVKDITEKAGYAVGSFYNYFKKKDDVFTELITYFYELMKDRLTDLNKQQVPTFKSIKELFKGYLKLFLKHKELVLVFIEQMGGINPTFTKMKYDFIDSTTEVTEKIISRLVDLRVTRPQNPKITARAWTGTLLEAYRWYVRYGKEEMTEDEWIENVSDFLIMGTVAKYDDVIKKRKKN